MASVAPAEAIPDPDKISWSNSSNFACRPSTTSCFTASDRAKMAPMSRGTFGQTSKVSKARQKPKKGGTDHHRNHRFESFSNRISKLNIEPLRRNANAKAIATMQDAQSRFKTSFVEWCDLNISENFRNFAQEIEPLCQSLPQVIHYENQIFEILTRYIQKRDELCLEPLLSLISHLAHDLGPRFEVHFQPAVAMVCHIAASHESIEVVEWSFTCLAYLFKFLSHLLVNDLRPLYDLMAPYMGKTRQKYFVARFAAESMSFLIKKAGARHSNDVAPLQRITEHAFSDLAKTDKSQSGQYAEGIARLFADSIRGVQHGLNPSGPAIWEVLLSRALRSAPLTGEGDSLVVETIEAIAINLIHHTNSEGFLPAFESALNVFRTSEISSDVAKAEVVSRMIAVFVGVRKGTRIASWDPLISFLASHLNCYAPWVSTLPRDRFPAILQAIAALLQYVPLTKMQPASQALLPQLEHVAWQDFYLGFCVTFERYDQERFNSLLSKNLQKFITKQWSAYQDALLVMLPKLLGSAGTSGHPLKPPSSWAQDLEADIKGLSSSSDDSCSLGRLSRALDLVKRTSIDSQTRERLGRSLLSLATSLLKNRVDLHQSKVQAFALGRGLEFALQNIDLADSSESSLQEMIDASRMSGSNVAYLSALRHLFKAKPQLVMTTASDQLMQQLLANLSSVSHDLRLLSLEIIQAGFAVSQDNSSLKLVTALLAVENTPFVFDNHRLLAKDIRSLAISFGNDAVNELTAKVVAQHLLGLLHVPLAPMWDEVAEALRSVAAANKDAEAVIASEALRWLEHDFEALDVANITQADSTPPGIVSGFHCTNLSHLDALALATTTEIVTARECFQTTFELETRPIVRYSKTSRTQILKAMNKLPQLIEKKSRMFVDCLMSGLRQEEEGEEVDSENGSSIGDEASYSQSHATWSLQDKRGALGVLAQFINPAVVYRSEDVYDCLLHMVANGDTVIQKNSLKALMVWRPESTRKYAENLLNLLDDARFREELTVFLGLDKSEQTIEMQHRPELMPILLRLLYGRVIARSGNANMRRSQMARRKAVLLAVARLGKAELKQFVTISLYPLHELDLSQGSDISANKLEIDLISPRKQIGVLRMIQDVVDTIPTHITPFAEMIMDVVIYCAIRAAGHEVASGHATSAISLIKGVRQESLGCLHQLFVSLDRYDWKAYTPIILQQIVRPRLHNLPIETAQGISGVLRLFAAWASSTNFHGCVVLDEPEILYQVSKCLVVPSAKDEVKIFILQDIIQTLYDSLKDNDAVQSPRALEVHERLRTQFGPPIINDITQLVSTQPEQRCLQASVRTLLTVGMTAEAGDTQQSLVGSLVILLRQPGRNVGLSLKADILRLLLTVLPTSNITPASDMFQDLWSTISTMFRYVARPTDRMLLIDALSVMAAEDVVLVEATHLCRKLNSYSAVRAGEPNFVERDEALNYVADVSRSPMPSRAWEMILNNLLYLVRDDEELAMRSGSSFAIQRFIEEATDDTADEALIRLITAVLSPALQRGMKESSELIKSEYLAILAKLASRSGPGFEDMTCLLGSDSESSVFSNILHIQHHRRARALHRLGAQADKLTSATISKFFIPLLEPFYSAEDADSSLAIAAVQTIGALCSGLDWQTFRSLVQSFATSKHTFGSKSHIRALGAAVRMLFSLLSGPDDITTTLARSLPTRSTISKWICNTILPKLLDFVHFKDESTVDLRAMVAVVAIRLVMVLPEDEIAKRLPPVLLDMTNVLRSRSQEARDAVRKTLSEITAFIGPEYFGFVLKQLRTALQRGAHLHVLSFTTHSLIVQVANAIDNRDQDPSKFGYGDIDYCAADIMAIVIEDIFGNVGAEKDAQEYVSKMMEVRRKNLSNDTLERLAKITTVEQAPAILKHVWEQLDKLRPRFEKIEELLQRLLKGWRENKDASNVKWLAFCYRLLKDSFERADGRKQLTSPSAVKRASFALELLRRTLDKHEDLKTGENLSGFMNILRNCLRQRNDEVQAAAMRTLTSIIKVPLSELDTQADEYVRLVKKIIEESPTVNAPLPQAALRLLAGVLRERPNAQIKESHFESHIAYVLSRMKPDLNEPAKSGDRDRQVAAFNLLRATLDRGVLISEVYEIMDVVREVMITTTEHPIPRLSRSVYTRFVLDYYPGDGKGLQKQMDFLINNLQYPSETGRLAVMEVLIFLINKRDATQLQPLLLDLFLPLVVVLGADESAACRSSARMLLQRMLVTADSESLRTFTGQMFKWIDKSAESPWDRIGLQFAAIYLTAHPGRQKESARIAAEACRVVETCNSIKKREAADLLETALTTLQQACGIASEFVFTGGQTSAWQSITALVNARPDGIKRLAARLFELYLGHLVKSSGQSKDLPEMPLTNDAGLSFTLEDADRAIDVHNSALRSTTEPDISQILTSNLGFIARILAASNSQDTLTKLLSNTAASVRVLLDTASLKPRQAALGLLHKLCSTVPMAGLFPSLSTILLSLNHLTDPTIPVQSATEPGEDDIPAQLTETAQETLDILREKLGPEAFVKELSKVQKEVKERREERRAKRKIDAVARPERAEKVKMRKHENSKNKRREKNRKMAGVRRGW